jgi:TonB family protein
VPPVAAPPPPPVQAERTPQPVKDPEPPKDPPKDTVKTPVAESFETTKTRKPLPKVSLKIVNAKPEIRKTPRQTDSQQQDQAEAQRRALAKAISSTARNLRDDVSAATIDTNYGPGGGGEAYANYDQVVKSVYQHAWVLPDTDVEDAIVKVRVIIARDGTVRSSQIVRTSGNAIVDTSIQRTLERVTFVAPFPEGAKDKERTFPLSFSLKAKRLLG